MSLIELTFIAGVVAATSAIALPHMTSGLDEFRARAAVRHLAGRLQEVRQEAVTRGGNVAVRFTQVPDGYVFAFFADGNGDGVRTADIAAGIDARLAPDERLTDHFPGVEFGAWPGLPAADPASSAPGTDPIRIGASDLLSFSPLGTATPGSLYVYSARNQYAVRVLGETGRVRVLQFHRASQTWRSL